MTDLNKNFTASAVTITKLLAHAVLDLFPKAQFIEEFAEGHQFCYQFFSHVPFESSQLELLENRMIQIKNEGFRPYLMEMMPSNAMGLFKEKGQKKLGETLIQSSETLVRVVRMGEYYDLVKSDFESNIDKTHFKLTHFEEVESKDGFLVTLFGLGAFDANQLKKEVKIYKELQKKGHVEIGQDQKLFKVMKDNWLFLPKGVALLNSIKNEIDKAYKAEGFKEISALKNDFGIKDLIEKSSLVRDKTKYFLWSKDIQISKNLLDVGLFKIEAGLQDEWFSVVNKKELLNECISYLKFYLQIIKILGFSYQVKCFSSKSSELQEMTEEMLSDLELNCELVKSDRFKIQIDLKDRFGRCYSSPYWTIEKKDELFLFRGSFCSSYEKLLAQLLEEHQGKLPISWNPEQLKILSLVEGKEFAKTVYDYFQKNNVAVTIDNSAEKLSVRLKKAYIEKVPRITIIGKKEQDEEVLTVKLEHLGKELTCSKEMLLEQILEELTER